MLNIPWFRDWFERMYGVLCEGHDFLYEQGQKLYGDWWMFCSMWSRGRWFDYPLAIGTIIFVQLPWVWVEYLWKKYRPKK